MKIIMEVMMNNDITLFKQLLELKCVYEMAGRLPDDIQVDKHKILIVAVGSDELNGIPHFHVFRSDKDKKTWSNGACIMFKHNTYFDHKHNQETLSEDELNTLVKVLHQQYLELNISNWKYLISLWNSNNYRYKIPYDLPIPDYNYNTISRYKE